MSISVEEKNTGHLEGLKNDSEKGPKRSVERTTRGVKLLLPIIITKYNRCHYSFLRQPRQQVTGGSGLGRGQACLASCVLAQISFPPKLRQGWCGSVTRRSVDTGAENEGPQSFTFTEMSPSSWLKAATSYYCFHIKESIKTIC